MVLGEFRSLRVFVITHAERKTNIAEHLFKFQCPTWEILDYWGLTILFYFINTLLLRSKVTTDSRTAQCTCKVKNNHSPVPTQSSLLCPRRFPFPLEIHLSEGLKGSVARSITLINYS